MGPSAVLTREDTQQLFKSSMELRQAHEAYLRPVETVDISTRTPAHSQRIAPVKNPRQAAKKGASAKKGKRYSSRQREAANKPSYVDPVTLDFDDHDESNFGDIDDVDIDDVDKTHEADQLVTTQKRKQQQKQADDEKKERNKRDTELRELQAKHEIEATRIQTEIRLNEKELSDRNDALLQQLKDAKAAAGQGSKDEEPKRGGAQRWQGYAPDPRQNLGGHGDGREIWLTASGPGSVDPRLASRYGNGGTRNRSRGLSSGPSLASRSGNGGTRNRELPRSDIDGVSHGDYYNESTRDRNVSNMQHSLRQALIVKDQQEQIERLETERERLRAERRVTLNNDLVRNFLGQYM